MTRVLRDILRQHALPAVAGAAAAVVLLLAMASNASALPEKFHGMNGHQAMFGNEADWEALEKAGVEKFRMQIKWNIVASAGDWRGEAAWQNTYDHYFEMAAKHHIEILPFLYTRENGSSWYFKTTDPGFPAWSEFVSKTVRRYRPGGDFWTQHAGILQYPVRAWEVWNEPNFNSNSPEEKANGTEYAKFLRATSEVIKSLDGSAVVLFGGIYQPDRGISLPTFLQEAKAANVGIAGYFDGLSVHPYGFGPVSDPADTESERLGSMQNNMWEARNALNALCAACNNKALWVTEVGWGVGGGLKMVSEAEQASLLFKSYDWLQGASPTLNIQYVAWFMYQDTYCCGDWAQYAGLKDFGGSDFRSSWYSYLGVTGKPRWPAHYMLGTSTGSNFTWNWTNLSSMYFPTNMATGDVNGDGKDDIVAAEPEGNGNVRYMLGTSTGSNFTWSTTSLTGMVIPSQVKLGDVNGDGKDDIVAVESEGNGKYRYMFGQSTGTNFMWNFTKLTGMGTPYAMALGDVNGDGKADIVAVESEGNGSYRYMFGQSTGSNFMWNFTSLTKMGPQWGMDLGDVNGDKKADIVAVEGEAGNKFRYMFGQSTGSNFMWNFTKLTGMGIPWGMALGDVNGDKLADIVSIEQEASGKFRYMFGQSTGSNFMWNFTNLTGMTRPEPLAVGDIGGDGKADVVGVEAY